MNAKTSGKEPEYQLGKRRQRTPTERVIYEEIYRAIIDHRLPPGTKLQEDSIGEIFGVSRTVVRSVLGTLSHDHIVEMRPYRSARVARPSPQEARDVFRARAVVEDEIVRQAAVKAGPAQIAELRELIVREHKAVEDGDRRQQIRLSGAFHIKLAEICGNGVLTDFLHALVSRTSLIIALYETPGNSACISDDHGALIEALAAGDPDAAAERMRRHLEDCERRLRLAEDGDGVDLAAVFRDFTSSAETSGEPA